MKLSEMTTNQVADALVLIAPDIEILVDDEELLKKLQSRKTTKNKDEAPKLGMKTILSIGTYLLKSQRQITWNILGVMNQKTPDEIGNQSFPATMKQIMEVLQDEDLLSFFTSSEKSESETLSE